MAILHGDEGKLEKIRMKNGEYTIID